MLPATPTGQSAPRRAPARIGAGAKPRSARARRAQRRAVMNSRRRPSTAVAIRLSSPGNGGSPGRAADSSYATTHAGSSDPSRVAIRKPYGLDYFGLIRNSRWVTELADEEADELLRALAHPAR